MEPQSVDLKAALKVALLAVPTVVLWELRWAELLAGLWVLRWADYSAETLAGCLVDCWVASTVASLADLMADLMAGSMAALSVVQLAHH